MWKIRWAPNNASKWQMGFNSVFKVLSNIWTLRHYFPTGRRNHSRPLKILLDTWDRNGSTSGPTPWQIYDDDTIFVTDISEECSTFLHNLINFRMINTFWKHPVLLWPWIAHSWNFPGVDYASATCLHNLVWKNHKMRQTRRDKDILFFTINLFEGFSI